MKKVGVIFSIILAIMGIVFAAGNAHTRLQNLEIRVDKKVNTERYESDMHYIKENLYEIKSILKDHQKQDD